MEVKEFENEEYIRLKDIKFLLSNTDKKLKLISLKQFRKLMESC